METQTADISQKLKRILSDTIIVNREIEAMKKLKDIIKRMEEASNSKA